MQFDFSALISQFVYNAKEPLLFNSAFFFYFFFFLLLIYRLVYKTKTLRIVTVILFSLYFFYKACGWYVGFILLAAIIDYNLSNAIYSSVSKHKKKALLVLSIVLNLGLLAYFKYTNLFIETFNDLQLGHLNLLQLYLPVGISFYTFENLSYTIDVYRGNFKPVKRFIDYLFFLTFFPKLMMGPIVRAADFIPQIRKDLILEARGVSEGLFLILTGLFKKVVISDYLYTNLVRMVFDDPSRFTGLECMFAIYGYALVIYSDFSGYSDMAIGMGKWLGFDINRNFDSPYQSLNITEFWRRWHMSLSSWLKDYLYISLGGNRNGKIRTNINLLITMLLGGLWHGASWNFLFWGFLHGSALIIHKKWVDNVVPKFSVFNKFPRTTNVIAVMITFHFVCFCWIFFKAENFTQAWTMIYQIATNFYVSGWSLFLKNYYSVLLVMILGFAFHFSPQRWCEAIIDKISDYPWWLKSVGAFSILYLIIQFKQAEPILPVYLQF